MTYKTIIYLLLAASACSVGLNIVMAIINYNCKMPLIGWEWNALAASVSIATFLWVLSWREE